MKVTTDGCLFGAWSAAHISVRSPGTRLLDIGTGTGLLSLMIAQKHQVHIDAIEIDPAAAAQAEANIKAASFGERIRIVNDNILHHEATNYDIIVSNPPFYENELIAATAAKNRAHHSSELLWDNLFAVLSQKLALEGCCYLLMPYKRKNDLNNLLQREGLFASKFVLVRQSPAHSPFRIMVQIQRQFGLTMEEEVVICDEGKNYTPAFEALLKDYYLNL